MTRIVECSRAVVEGREERDFAFVIENARIVAAGHAALMRTKYPQTPVARYDDQTLVVPGFINGHSHAYQILMRGWADDLPFERWRADALYKVVPQLSPDDVYWTFRMAFDEMLAAGITTVAEFFYLNGAGNEHAREAIRAANDAGIRLIFARTWMDAEYAPDAFRESTELAVARTQALRTEFPQVDVCVAPHSLHAASPAMIRAAALFAGEYDCMMHVHVAEAQYEGEQTLQRFGKTPIALLESLEALNERTVAIHAIYISQEEQRAMGRCRARVIHNPTTNQYLGDGICDVGGLLATGVPVGLGTDADVKPSIIDEMRAASLLQKIAHLDGASLGAAAAFRLGTAGGAAALRVAAGDLRPGAYADYVVLDARAIDAWSPAINAVVYRADTSWVRETYVGGRCVRTFDAPTTQARQRIARLLPALQL